MKPTIILWWTYTDRNGKEFDCEVHFDGDRKAGLREWTRKAIANGGRADKADSALQLTVKEKK